MRARIDGPEAFSAAFGVSRETVHRLACYEALLRRWQRAVNLVAPSTLTEIWHRHFADSAQLAPLIPVSVKNLVDLGSGGGFPGLVLAIMLADRPNLRVRLIESDQRKAAFLRDVSRHTGVPVDIVPSRIECEETQASVGSADVVTARALAPLDRLLELAAALFGSETVGLFLKGRAAAREVSDARIRWRFDAELVGSVTEASGSVVVIRQLRRKRGK
ncbi:MAG TPA: 16S rRNA (guanine(527)-N(7))-methyltransferase RsmG [Hyphomicrobiaceae bacterium]|nr:16S rRNA (guanine(527)-N(7))-methyltransferase RsmG [Hyphomicrobiaceae bacterium]